MVEMEVESSDEEGDDRKTMKNDDNVGSFYMLLFLQLFRYLYKI